MKLLATLQSGFADAPGGSALIYRRGTTTKATCYTDFAGTLATTTHSLDGNGRCRRFVNELVDVKVLDADGTQVVETFTEGDQATGVEIIHPHVTGTDYTTGASGLNKPSTLQLDLTRRYTSFGADDSQVLVGGVARNLKDVLLTGFIDVKGPTYAATGNGVTDDTVPVQAAITAANAAGGGIVLFPPGTYKVTSLTIPSNVSLLGAGAGKSIITTTSTSEVLLVASGAFTAYGIKFQSTGKGLIRFTAAVGNTTTFTACSLVCTNAATVDVVTGSDNTGLGYTFVNLMSFTGCEFVQTGAGGTKTFAGDGCSLHGCTITFVSGKAFGGDYVRITSTYIEYQGAVAGSLHSGALGVTISMVGCAVATSGAGALTISTTPLLFEVGTTTLVGGGAIGFDGVVAWSGIRESTTVATSGSATSYAPTPLTARAFAYASSGASFQWANPTGASTFKGYDITLVYKNTSGGAITPTFDTMYKGSAVSVGNGQACGWRFFWNTSLSVYQQVGSVVAYNS